MTEVTASNIIQGQQRTQQQSQKLAQDFDDFLNLLTTQMQNQDPLSPMESTEFTNQLVGFSQVEQQINSNEKLEQLLSLQLSNISSVALGYVGMEVTHLGNNAYYDGQTPMTFNYSIEGDAATARLNIADENGRVVRSVEVGTDGNTAEWDGKNDLGFDVPAGNYKVTVDALDTEGNAVKAQTAVPGKVVGIEAQDGTVQLLLEGDGIVPINAVLKAREPATAPQQPQEGNT